MLPTLNEMCDQE